MAVAPAPVNLPVGQKVSVRLPYVGALPATVEATGPGIGRISVRTLYLWSSDDPALPRDAAAGTAQHMSGPYQYVELEGVSHWIPEDVPGELNRLLLDHLAGSR